MRHIHNIDIERILKPCVSTDVATSRPTVETISRQQIQSIAGRLQDIAVDLQYLMSETVSFSTLYI
jgi:hypothetical protein